MSDIVELIDIDEVAEMTGFSFDKIYDLIKKKKIIRGMIGGGFKKQMWNKEVIIQFMADYNAVKKSKKNFLSFTEARDFMRGVGLKSWNEWKEYSATIRPDFIPADPHYTYKDEFTSSHDWLGYEQKPIGGPKKNFKSYEDARAYVRSLCISTEKEFNDIKNKDSFPVDIPKNPRTYYAKKGWISINDFLGVSKNNENENKKIVAAPRKKRISVTHEAKIAARRFKCSTSGMMTSVDLAEYLNVGLSSIYAWCANGGIPHIRVGKSIRFKKSDIEKWINRSQDNKLEKAI